MQPPKVRARLMLHPLRGAKLLKFPPTLLNRQLNAALKQTQTGLHLPLKPVLRLSPLDQSSSSSDKTIHR